MAKNNAASPFRRYQWNQLSEAEQEAVSDGVSIALTRAGVGIGVVLTAAALISSARAGKKPLPPVLRYGSLLFFTITGAYIGCLSACPTYMKRILAVPNSKLADELRIVAGDWQARVPNNDQIPDVLPHAPLPDPNKPGQGDVMPEVERQRLDTNSANVARNEAAMADATMVNQNTNTSGSAWTWWFGSRKS